jgi:hypothetical protein
MDSGGIGIYTLHIQISKNFKKQFHMTKQALYIHNCKYLHESSSPPLMISSEVCSNKVWKLLRNLWCGNMDMFNFNQFSINSARSWHHQTKRSKVWKIMEQATSKHQISGRAWSTSHMWISHFGSYIEDLISPSSKTHPITIPQPVSFSNLVPILFTSTPANTWSIIQECLQYLA